MTPVDDNAPIFILGMLQRTGTNHLWDLFGLHPDVESLEPVFEDHLVRWSPHLLHYVQDVTSGWTEDWDVPAEEGQALLRSLGDGILSWVASHSERRVVTKMPSVESAHHFFQLFDRAPLVVLVRDGRSVCQSGVKSFGWSYERAFRRWSRAADVVLDLMEHHGDDPRLTVLRYEELIDDPVATMKRLCAATGLDDGRYPFAEIDHLPVRGSSALAESGSAVHWAPVNRTNDFDPRQRWRDWDPHRHRRFAAVAGAQQLALGYDLETQAGSDTIVERARDLRDLADVRMREARVWAGRSRRAVKRVKGKI